MSLYYDNFRFYWAVVTKKRLNIVFAKVPYLSGNSRRKNGFSPVIDIFEK